MGLERVPYTPPSLRSLTTALGLDDGSVEEVLFHKSASSHGTLSIPGSSQGRRPRSRTLSIASYDSTSLHPSKDWTSSASRSTWSPRGNPEKPLPSTPVKKSSQVSSKQAKEANADSRSILDDIQCSDAASSIRPSCVVNEASYDTWASTSQSTSFADEALSPPRPSASTIRTRSMYDLPRASTRPKFHWPSRCWESTKKIVHNAETQRHHHNLDEINSSDDIKENPTFAAINAGLSGMPFADLILHCVSDDWETHAHSFIISSTCPALFESECCN